MKRRWLFALPAVLAAGATLSSCYDDRPGRHRPPHDDHRHDRHDRDRDRDHRHDGDGRHDRGDRGDRGHRR